jgi:hypothetical protein
MLALQGTLNNLYLVAGCRVIKDAQESTLDRWQDMYEQQAKVPQSNQQYHVALPCRRHAHVPVLMSMYVAWSGCDGVGTAAVCSASAARVSHTDRHQTGSR